jgi:hypothetical protein
MSNVTSEQLQQAIAIINKASSQPPELEQKQGGSWAYKLMGFMALAGVASIAAIFLYNNGFVKNEAESLVDSGIELTTKQQDKVDKAIYANMKVRNRDKAIKAAKQYANDITEAEHAAYKININKRYDTLSADQKARLNEYECKQGIGDCPAVKDINPKENIYQAEDTPIIRKSSRSQQFSFMQAMGINNANANEFRNLPAPPEYKPSKKEIKRQLQALRVDSSKSDEIKGLIALHGGIR